jgi:hypothetical protein
MRSDFAKDGALPHRRCAKPPVPLGGVFRFDANAGVAGAQLAFNQPDFS